MYNGPILKKRVIFSLKRSPYGCGFLRIEAAARITGLFTLLASFLIVAGCQYAEPMGASRPARKGSFKEYPPTSSFEVPKRFAKYCEDYDSLRTTHFCDPVYIRFNYLTGEPYYRENPQYIDQAYLEKLMTWRNPRGRPFSLFVLEENSSLRAKYNYSIRLAIATMHSRSALLAAFRDAYAGRSDEEFAAKEISEYATRWYGDLVPEMFAWYTSPAYKKGFFVPEMEAALERMVRFESMAADGLPWRMERNLINSYYDYPGLIDSLSRTLEKARAPIPEGPEPDRVLVSHDDWIFLYILEWQEYHGKTWPGYYPKTR